MLFAVIVTDKPDCGDIRAAPLPAHIAWLEAHKDIIPVGGSAPRRPLARRGRLQSPDRGPAQSDPFFTASLRQHYEILHWSKANDARKVLI